MRLFAICAAVLLASGAFAEGERAGRFDYYVLALSWSPGWCATEGRDRDARQCEPGSGASFVLHGLWPQFEAGWPSDCRSASRDPSRAQTAAMADIMGSDGAAWHQWKKHGRCSGLAAADYYARARQAYESVAIPVPFQELAQDVRLPAAAVEAAFLAANPGLSPEGVRVTCAGERIDELRICLTKDLLPRPCGADVRRDCRKPDALMERVR
ncbi:ribonuclease T2 [Rhodobacter capsulatus]|uniref:ribonuclease T2 family protein n=1 Tax=Rhodobacter capsulatus TaxID=1061 RepID=UPI0006DCDB5B|nr:ribonuclease T2 [Rhodobacter capsulatus]KQB13318.1 ribonuclease T [Rhodobacter capsulatus]KQB13576.1 ribonuclease T [Rhodobacter capsulatus]PZX24312.1 ribonuclease T2 [Rhodobacter capsulatus]QNR63713.1 ribonuclease T2 [Rhodobacter capsulatus]